MRDPRLTPKQFMHGEEAYLRRHGWVNIGDDVWRDPWKGNHWLIEYALIAQQEANEDDEDEE